MSTAGLGANFALTMVVALDHFEGSAAARALAPLMQGGVFLLAAVAPWIVTLLHDETGNFTAGWVMYLVNVVIVTALTIRLSPKSYMQALPPALRI